MRFERLVMEAGDQSLALDLHPRLTILAGVEELDRDALIGEIIGALGSGRDGLHLELRSDSDERFAIFRPRGAPHRVVRIDDAVDVTPDFVSNGAVDLLSKAGLDTEGAHKAMCLGRVDLVTATERELHIRQLALLDQNELWAAAEAMTSAKRRLGQESEEMNRAADDEAMVEEIESRHERVENHQTTYEQRRKITIWALVAAVVLALPVKIFLGMAAAGALALVAVLAGASSLYSLYSIDKAREQEEAALDAAGAQSYLGFHLQRVNGLLSDDQARKRMAQAVEENKEALRRWNVIAGSLDVDWVMANRETVTAAVRLRNDVMGTSMLTQKKSAASSATSDHAHTLVTRLADLRGLGTGRENFPALLNDPFSELDDTALATLLELLLRSSHHQQIVMMTADDRIAAWARVEAMTGELGLIEPRDVFDTEPHLDVTEREKENPPSAQR